MENNRYVKDFRLPFEDFKGSLQVLETNVPVEKQMEYFRFSEVVRKDLRDGQSLEKQMKILSSPQSSYPEIKYALAFLAISGDVKAYRAIESYNKTNSDDWSAMSLMQAKITLESELSEERQIFISTGLGGKGERLRFFALFKSKGGKKFSGYQKKLIEKEMLYSIQNRLGILEEIQIRDNYFTVLFLIHFRTNIRMILQEAITECNQYGDFINKGFIITNVKVLSEEEIQNELKKKG